MFLIKKKVCLVIKVNLKENVIKRYKLKTKLVSKNLYV